MSAEAGASGEKAAVHTVHCRENGCNECVTLPEVRGRTLITEAAHGWTFTVSGWWRCPAHNTRGSGS